MLKKNVITVVFAMFALLAKGQITSFKANATEQQKSESLIYKNFINECDFMIAYTRESYWWRKRKYYSLLALNRGTWYKGYFFSEQLKSGKWTYPKVRFEEVDADSASFIISYLDKAGFYKLSTDSLHMISKKNNDGSVSMRSRDDGVDYKFEILYKNELALIEAYEPEMYLEFLPEIKTRETFIKYRDWFELKYRALEAIDQ